jgi:hypothetical protein
MVRETSCSRLRAPTRVPNLASNSNIATAACRSAASRSRSSASRTAAAPRAWRCRACDASRRFALLELPRCGMQPGLHATPVNHWAAEGVHLKCLRALLLVALLLVLPFGLPSHLSLALGSFSGWCFSAWSLIGSLASVPPFGPGLRVRIWSAAATPRLRGVRWLDPACTDGSQRAIRRSLNRNPPRSGSAASICAVENGSRGRSDSGSSSVGGAASETPSANIRA